MSIIDELIYFLIDAIDNTANQSYVQCPELFNTVTEFSP